jgi:hypothetical protein
MKKLKDPARMTKSSRRDPHGRSQLTMINLANVLDEGLRSEEEQRLEILDRDWHMMYPSSRPRGGGSLHPASNLVYDHNGVYMEPP